MNDTFQPKSLLLSLVALASITGLMESSDVLAGQAEPRSSCNLILSSHRWIGSDGKPLPFQTDEEAVRSPGQGSLQGWWQVIAKGTNKGLSEFHRGARVAVLQGEGEVKMPCLAFTRVTFPPRQMPTVQIRQVT